MLPIVERELRVQSRRPRTFWFRVTAAALSCGACLLFLVIAAATSSPGRTGRTLFYLLGWPAFVICLLEGIRVTADSLSEEKREGTLGLIFLTDLRAIDIVLGKQAGVALNSFYGLFGIFPALGIPLMLGGVTGGEFWRLILTLIVTLTISLSIGMLVSACVNELMAAWLWTASALVALVLGLPLMHEIGLALGLDFPIQRVSPGTAMISFESSAYDLSSRPYWWSIGSGIVLSVVCLGSACVALPRFWQTKDPELSRSRNRRSSADSERRLRLLNSSPTLWLATRHQGSVDWPIALVVLALAAQLLTILFSPLDGSAIMVCAAVGAISHFGLVCWQSLCAVKLGSEFRSYGMMELMFITSLQPQEIVMDLGRGVMRRGLKAGLLLAFGEIVCLSIIASLVLDGNAKELGGVVFGILITLMIIGAFTVDLWAGSWMGLYQALTRPSRASAIALTASWVQLSSLLLFFCCFWLSPILCAVKGWCVGLWARDRLLFEFPRLLRERFDKPI